MFAKPKAKRGKKELIKKEEERKTDSETGECLQNSSKKEERRGSDRTIKEMRVQV